MKNRQASISQRCELKIPQHNTRTLDTAIYKTSICCFQLRITNVCKVFLLLRINVKQKENLFVFVSLDIENNTQQNKAQFHGENI